jgi:hypothetical protein
MNISNHLMCYQLGLRDQIVTGGIATEVEFLNRGLD